jgi:hypothetical protein
MIDGNGATLQPLSLANDSVQVEYSANETIRVLFEWE